MSISNIFYDSDWFRIYFVITYIMMFVFWLLSSFEENNKITIGDIFAAFFLSFFGFAFVPFGFFIYLIFFTDDITIYKGKK